MIGYLFAAVLTGEVLLGGALILTLLSPSFRVWPPPRRKSWQFKFSWGLTIYSFTGVFVLGILDRNSFIFSHRIWILFGMTFLTIGFGLVIWGVRTLGLR